MPESTSSAPREHVEQHVLANRWVRPLDKILVGLLILSLLMHVLTFVGLFGMRNLLISQITQLADGVQQAKATTVRYNFPIDQQLPINISVPIERSIQVPIRTDVRINQTITIPINTSFGSTSLPVPIDATIPISTTVPIEIKQNWPISATVPIQLQVPLELDMGSPEFAGYFDQLYRTLIELRDRL